jgi:hypothetical protein
MVIKFNPEGRVVMVLGRKQEESDEGTGSLKRGQAPSTPKQWIALDIDGVDPTLLFKHCGTKQAALQLSKEVFLVSLWAFLGSRLRPTCPRA